MTLSRNLLALLVVAFVCYSAQSSFLFAVEEDARSNLILGSLGPGDDLVYNLLNAINRSVGASGILISNIYYQGPVNITYITAIENGPTENATASLSGGGVGTDNAAITITSADGGGFNYTISIYGIWENGR